MIGTIVRLYSRLRSLVRGARDEDVREELRFHVELLEEEYRAAGMDPEEARAAALRRFGNTTRLAEQSRELFSFQGLDDFRRDLILGLRAIGKSKGFALTTILALAVAIGSNITVFGFVDAMLLRPMNVREPNRLIRAYSDTDSRAFIEYSDYLEYRDGNQTLSSLAMSQWGGLYELKTDGSPALVVHAMPVTGNYFETLGVTAALGRAINSGDDKPGSQDVVMLSDACWRRYYNADPAVIGRTISLNKTPFTIVGALPPSFHGTDGSTLVPMHYIPWKGSPNAGYLIGRLKAGITKEQAQADLARIASKLSVESNRRKSIVVYPARATNPLLLGQFSLLAVLFMAVVGIVFLIACANVAILLLSKSTARRREIGVRLALGASKSQLVRQLLAENLILSLAGGALGMGLAAWTGSGLTRFTFPVPMPHGLLFEIDWRVAAFAAAITVSATLVFGLAPALQSAKTDVLSSLKEGPRSDAPDGSRIRSGLLTAQIALCTTLLVTTTVLIRSLDSPARQAGFDTERVLMASVSLPEAGYTPETSVVFYERMLHDFEQTPGITTAAIVDNIPLMPNTPLTAVQARDGSGKAFSIYTGAASRGEFRTLGIPLLEGRDFTARDDAEDKPVGIVNETLARQLSRDRNPVGMQLQMADGVAVVIVGVVRDIKYESIDEEPKAFLYRPVPQQPAPAITFLVKTTGDPMAAAPALRQQIARFDPDLVVYNLGTLEERVGLNLLPNRAAALLGGVLGIIASALSTIGTYGAMAFLTQRRTREIGIRIAIGAPPRSVVRLLTRHGMMLTCAGLGLGLAGAVGLTTLLRRLLYGISVFNPIAFAGVAFLLGGIAILACYIPARRACRTDPAAVLREG